MDVLSLCTDLASSTRKFMFWLTQLEADSIERKHYDEILRCSIRKSGEICLVLCYNKKMFNLSGSAGWDADPYLLVMTIKACSS